MVLEADAAPAVGVVVVVVVVVELPGTERPGGIVGAPLRCTGFVLLPLPVEPLPVEPLPVPPVLVVVEPLPLPVVSGVALAAAMPNFIAASPASAAPTSGAAPLKWSLKFAMRLPWSKPGVPAASWYIPPDSLCQPLPEAYCGVATMPPTSGEEAALVMSFWNCASPPIW